MSQGRNAKPEYVKLEQRLVLLTWLNSLFGYESNRHLLADLREAGEGFDASGRSYVCHRLIARGDKVQITTADLARYDDNIREHLGAMNARRSDPITLRYFQHLALLYTEIFLDGYFNYREARLRSLNEFVAKRNLSKNSGEVKDARFSETDLKKLAYWMATGSGKTLIMHINYRQFLRYNNSPLDNIVLITPNEGLSEQHIEEMTASNIPCRRFDLNESGLGISEPDAVRVIEITKLVEEKRGGGQSVPVEAFEGNNLIFVDEGHKGSGGEAWRSFRDALGQTGFTFEYSATFGQALTAARNDKLTEEYGKGIVFDYSYRYFHGDGYGKDFRILNLKEEAVEDKTEMLLLGNLLSFYEQQRVFEEGGEALRPYNLEKPLWVFVGSSVNAVYTENKQKRSDVLTVARFLHHLLENKKGWAVKAIKMLLDGKTGLEGDPDGQDIFAEKFQYLKDAGIDAETAYHELLGKVLHSPTGGGLHLCDLRGSPGELGLKASGGEYFGLIYIGDTSAFKKLVEVDDAGITVEEDAIADSLFEGINEPETSVEILIGAKKFMEGWNSWRVSNMGLLNIGRKEGSEIIQLFGRGVRLRGKDFTLKRSSALDGSHPEHLPVLETLNIFAVRANYMPQFQEHLEKEGVETEGHVELSLPIRTNDDFLRQGLVVPRIPDDRSFADEAAVLLDVDPAIRVRVDMSLKVQTFESGVDGFTAAAVKAGCERAVPDASLNLVDWERVYLELLEYKERKGMRNLAIRPDLPRAIFDKKEPSRLYSVVADDNVVQPVSFAGTALLHEAVLTVLRKYTDKFYRVQQERWDSENMVYKALGIEDSNFQDYIVKVPRGDVTLIGAIQKLIDDADSIYGQDLTRLPTIHFDRHLYQPLLIERGNKVRSDPPGLKASERQFVDDLRAYCRAERDGALAYAEVYLLRNLSRGKGIGFFETRGFYPDFILWIKTAHQQRIVFVEPHGMLRAEAYKHDDKARLHESLPKLAKAMCTRTNMTDVVLDSFIVSATTFDDLRTKYDDGGWDKDRFALAHILFPVRDNDYDYIRRIVEG
ncbi:DEAD/DEAH box helicase family protein [Thioalkalivibrio sp. ALMg11]|uniref:DEAD/DEAH box helicase family protein n=1 Tax=Thioalkalivibrio sp. ALMg11 TaxID=1158165 RepID=UPI00037616E9|nr:DEAD/DEAH box helicase family protein [Thioalkalivibrio sp. ALMg11]